MSHATLKEITVFVACIVIVVLGWISIKRLIYPVDENTDTVQEIMVEAAETEEEAERIQQNGAFNIKGTIWNGTPDLSTEHFERAMKEVPEIKTEADIEKAEAIFTFFVRPEKRPVPDAVVTLYFGNKSLKTKSGPNGVFTFKGLPRGKYRISAEALLPPPTKTEPNRITMIEKEFNIYRSDANIDIDLRADAITLKGRVTDEQGNAIAGAKISGVTHPTLESPMPPVIHTVSDKNGYYEFRQFRTNDIFKVMRYLRGYKPNYNSMYTFFLEIKVEAPGFTQKKECIPMVPIVSEELINGARQLGKLMNEILKVLDKDDQWIEKEDMYLPPTYGNIITDIDIILE
jgi:hypothetical protein